MIVKEGLSNSAISYSSVQFGNELPTAHTALSAAFIYYVQLLATALLTHLKSVSEGAMNIIKRPRTLLFSVGNGTTNALRYPQRERGTSVQPLKKAKQVRPIPTSR